ncbi:hypothetical protein N6H14_32185 [Paenibacillus sp. CC-CFT747]|nr:hypothetical protein N6H14_32185 [Paenibacillus sp. CC-CFT747]
MARVGEAPAYPMRERGILVPGSPEDHAAGAAFQQFTIGTGFIDRWAVDIPSTIVQLQQGAGPVTEDGAPAPDGTAELNDGFLKADDVFELDWEWDRKKTETGQPYFSTAYADLWREELIGHLLQCALGMELTVPFVDYWPEGVSYTAVLSHDSDGNLEEEAQAALELLEECRIQSTWCMLEPGYSAETYSRIREAGHELAFHYNAVEPDEGFWDESEFRRQLEWLRKAIGEEGPLTNKNHLTRIEGWGEFFRWCEGAGITCDQSRGPSKKGNSGFLYGTCHPYFPISWSDESNRLYNVLQIGFLTQDLDHGKWADSSVIVPYLEEVRKVRGAAHFVVHQYHIYRREEVRDSMRRIVAEARKRGFAFWTIGEIEEWERWRRELTIKAAPEDGRFSVMDSKGNSHWQGKKPVVWIPVSAEEPAQGTAAGLTQRFGVWCRQAAPAIEEA